MSMSDEEFEKALSDIEVSTWSATVDHLRARDTAQREALARVEAEHATWMEQYDSVVRYGNELLAKHDIAQAQLAEAVGLLKYAMESSSFREIFTLERDIAAFLARHAQAEQQEAKPQFPLRNPRSAKFQAALEETFQKFESMTDVELEAVVAAHMPQQEAQGAQAGDRTQVSDAYWRGWNDRAALATQPAAGEPVAYCDDFTLGMLKSGQAYSVGVTPYAQRHEGESHALYAAPPAAAPVAAGEPVAWATRKLRGMQKGQIYLCGPFAAMPLDRWEKPFPLYAAPPAAAHGDEAVRKDAEDRRSTDAN